MTSNQRIFCDEYLRNGRNATRAYMVAYPKIKNENSAKVLASRLLTNANVSEYIREQIDALHISAIADVSEILAYFTDTMRNERIEPRDRNQAAKELAKMLGVDSGIERERLSWEREDRAKAKETADADVTILDDIPKEDGE